MLLLHYSDLINIFNPSDIWEIQNSRTELWGTDVMPDESN